MGLGSNAGMTARHIGSVLCQHVFVDAQTNHSALVRFETVTLLKEIDMRGETVVAIPIAFELLTLWYRDEVGHPIHFAFSVSMVGPSGKVLAETPVEGDFSSEHRRNRSRIRFEAMLYEGPGTYLFRVTSDGVTVADVPLWVGKQETMAPQGATPGS